ncbi:MAG: DUF131 domain-containing protein [Theionarchaea archaeon]|nr:DUF131 domain-containing protein [Theionarchaea archaeon]
MQKLIALGMLVIVAGFVLIALGIVGSMFQVDGEQQGEMRAGGVILIGPIPLVFGNDKTMILVSIAGAILFLLAYSVWRKG